MDPWLPGICLGGSDQHPGYSLLLVLSHGEAKHAVITAVPRAFLHHQVVRVDIEAAAGGEERNEKEEKSLHDEVERRVGFFLPLLCYEMDLH